MTTRFHFSENNVWLHQLTVRFRQWTHRQQCLRARRKDYEKLAKLPDYLLEDMGIQRSELNLKLSKRFWWS